jgi:hypothetical protein
VAGEPEAAMECKWSGLGLRKGSGTKLCIAEPDLDDDFSYSGLLRANEAGLAHAHEELNGSIEEQFLS